MTTQAEKGATFVALHQQDTFVMPNFWDIGSAKLLEKRGAQAIASTSAGFAESIGLRDGQISLQSKLQHLCEVAAATNVPINADFEHGFADAPEACAANLQLAADTGIVGASIEDWSRSDLYEKTLAAERIQACAEIKRKFDFPFVLTARAENLLRGIGTIDDTIYRLQAYEAAGADVLYAPGLKSLEEIRTVMSAVNKPLNVLFVFMPAVTVAEYQGLGVRRISLGSALSNHATAVTSSAVKTLLEDGRFDWAK